ncbi:MAG TPA: LysR substrate-binding domain-containing protein [Polyangiaceae bacterium]|nr:LysR substrate-binding domain-containing protein [Polyangiaceae bacterium]
MTINRVSLQDLTLRQLQYVVAVADTLGFRRAAERCAVSQPSLSAQIQQLEAALGVVIFERDRRQVLVTPSGVELVARARRVLVEAEDLVAVATRARDPFTGTLRVGVIPTIAPYLLPDVAQALAEEYPALRLVFREDKTEDVTRALRAGALDVGLVALEAELGELRHAKVLLDPFVVAMAPGHTLAKKAKLTQADLDGQDVLLLDDGHCLRTQALALCAKAGAREVGLRATSLATLVQMVARGPAVTLLPELAVPVENRRAQLAIRRFTAPPLRTLALVWRPRSPLGATIDRIAATLRARLRPPTARAQQPPSGSRPAGASSGSSASSQASRPRKPR